MPFASFFILATGLAYAAPLPGATPMPPEIARRLERASRPLGAQPRYTNRLALESSPYLRQHAHNPVNWYPWGDEAFEAARRLSRPVLLSIGYSTCHWCHVMEEESFEDAAIAGVMNENYVAIKVDREERPDIDAVYMSAVQSFTGGGGWPMTVWLTPDRRPFFAGTYFPAHDGDRGARRGFLSLLNELKKTYDADPARVAERAEQIVQAIRAELAPASSSNLPSVNVLDEAAAQLQRGFDDSQGGLRGAPKFPSSLPIRFLLRQAYRTGHAEFLQMAELTLSRMAAGGIHDQIGGGFHRYATDAAWRVPHFEKMLYDNALLAVDYLEAYQATHRAEFADIARDILHYARRDMRGSEGAFYAATDADSSGPDGHREEGRFFTWTQAEIEQTVGRHRAPLVQRVFGVTSQGNFEGRSILHVADFSDLAKVGDARERLYRARATRPAPLRDEKILASWNGLMISALAKAALILGDRSYAADAARAADFILTKMRKNGRLLHSAKEGVAAHDAYLDDYAFFISGLIDLYESTGEPRWLTEAIALDAVLAQHYEDANGGFFLAADDAEKLLAREKGGRDGAEPSGNSVEVENLLRLGTFTSDDRYRERAERALGSFSAMIESTPTAMSCMLLALDYLFDSPKEIVLVTSDATDAEPFLAKLRETFLPNRILVVVPTLQLPALARIVPLVEGKSLRQGKPTAYVCERRICQLPTTDPEVFAKQLIQHAKGD